MKIRDAVFETPWYDTHCHMACNEAVGMSHGTAGAFACDTVRGMALPTMDLWALLTAPYMKWMVMTIGENVDAQARKAGHASALEWARTDPGAWWAANWRYYARLGTTGVSRALARGIRELHGVELRFEEDAPVEAINEKIRGVYEDKGFYGWWAAAFAKLNCVRAVKLVEMTWYDRPPASAGDWEKERALVTTALRVDSFTALHLPAEHMGFRLWPREFGIEADGLEDYLAQMERTLERARAGGMRALKNAVAYSGPLNLPPPDLAAAERYVRDGRREDYRAFEAAVLRRLLEWANARDFPYQMHAGVVVVPWCNCELLAEQIQSNPRVRFTLLHIYPYLREAGCLARIHENVFLDPCWLSILSPETLRAALREWIGMVPPEKLLYGVDATSVEEWFGGAIAAKEAMAEVLEEKVRAGEMNEAEARAFARQALHDTAHAWYG
jgi:hypothetical protein